MQISAEGELHSRGAQTKIPNKRVCVQHFFQKEKHINLSTVR